MRCGCALTGRTASPGLFEVAVLLGGELTGSVGTGTLAIALTGSFLDSTDSPPFVSGLRGILGCTEGGQLR